MLTDQMLAAIRADVATFLTDTCTIYRPNTGMDADGFRTGGETAVASGVACRVIRSKTTNYAGQVLQGEANRVHFRLIVPYGTDIRDKDRVDVAGERLEVLGVVNRLSDEAYIETDTVRIPNNG